MHRRSVPLLVILLTWAPACTERPNLGRDSGTSGGSDGGDGGERDRPDVQVPPVDECVERARWIYLVDSGNALLRFEPDTGTITRIGTLSCPATGTPFSMAVDRQATAYVLFQDHRLYQVSTADASCTTTPYVPDQRGFELFGMGFVADSAGSPLEHLFIGGGPELGIGGGSATLGRIDLPGWTVTSIGPLGGSPELTGNGAGELWGFLPDSTPMSVRQLDKASGGTLRMIDVSAIDPSGFPPSAWAFAFWGGRFYVFYQGLLDPSTAIWRVTPDTSAVEPVRTNIGYRIVGAGVSTCAPTILI
jgi:hypothetical protein